MWYQRAGCVLALVAVAASTASAQRRVKSDQDTLIELEERWDAAFHNHDQKFIDTLLAEEFVVTYGDGSRGDRAKELTLALDDRQRDARHEQQRVSRANRHAVVVWDVQAEAAPARIDAKLRREREQERMEPVCRDLPAGDRHALGQPRFVPLPFLRERFLPVALEERGEALDEPRRVVEEERRGAPGVGAVRSGALQRDGPHLG